jgi:hypothetical protein
MCKLGIAVELEDILQFEFKLAELYFLKELRTHESTQAGT